MKNASVATKALLAGGRYIVYALYEFQLAGGQTLFVADSDFPLTVGGQLYQHGLVIQRDALKQVSDLSVQTMKLDIAPQLDIPGGPPTVAGFSFLQAVRLGLFDAAIVTYSRLYLAPPSGPGVAWPDTSPGAVTWFTGVVADTECGRLKATFSVNNTLELLNLQMPRNLVQPGCSHIFLDAGCDPTGTVKTANTFTGTIGSGGGVLSFPTSLTNATGNFDLGRIVFTSGVNAGFSRTVRSYVSTSGQVTLLLPLNSPPNSGDGFTIYSGCDKSQARCTALSNLAHYRGLPYVPDPATLYGGTASAPPAGSLQPLGPGSGPGSSGRYTFKP